MPFFSLSSLIVLATALLVGSVLLFYKPLGRSSSWKATITPLASIMGSGFLVCAPLLYETVGNYALPAMVALLCLAYAVGSVIRYNIRYGEPLFERHDDERTSCPHEHPNHVGHWFASGQLQLGLAAEWLEKFSHVALAAAYCVSVSYYLQLLAGFALEPLGVQAAWPGKVLVTVILALIGFVGTTRGLKGIERVERIVVGINLAMISALVVGLLYHNFSAFNGGTWHLRALPTSDSGWHVARVLMGLLIVVQGFETSRFLGAGHPREERIATMKQAQLISATIYILFIGAMALVISGADGFHRDGITAIVDLSASVAVVLPLLITITALGSQFSAATADDAGCSGLLETLLPWIPARFDYLLVSGAAVALTWLTDVYEIISHASRAFALFYALQCLVALLVMRTANNALQSRGRAAFFATLAVICLLVTVFGIPAG